LETDLLRKLGDKEITKVQLFHMVESNFGLVPVLLKGTGSSNATVRYGCGKTLMDLSEKRPNMLYKYLESFIELLDSEYRILKWNAMAIIANLTKVDVEFKFDANFDKYYSFLNDEYMVTVANTVKNSSKIALEKPYLTQKIASELLKVQKLKLTPHLTEECRLVITEQAIKTFNIIFDQIETKEKVLAFAQKYTNSSRVTLKEEAQRLIKNWRKTG
jgi:hypothetical protein